MTYLLIYFMKLFKINIKEFEYTVPYTPILNSNDYNNRKNIFYLKNYIDSHNYRYSDFIGGFGRLTHRNSFINLSKSYHKYIKDSFFHL